MFITAPPLKRPTTPAVINGGRTVWDNSVNQGKHMKVVEQRRPSRPLTQNRTLFCFRMEKT